MVVYIQIAHMECANTTRAAGRYNTSCRSLMVNKPDASLNRWWGRLDVEEVGGGVVGQVVANIVRWYYSK